MAGGERALDLELLDQQTFGDRELAEDLLGLFETQCARLWPVISRSPDRQARSDAAHTLKGGAAAIGATEVMRLAGEIETVLDGRNDSSADEVLPALEQAIDAARAEIGDLRGRPEP